MDEKTRKQIELATVPVRSKGMKPGEGPQGVYIGNGFVLTAAHCLKFDTYGGIALVFFLDLPSREEKDAIWKIYRNLYEVDPTQSIPDDTKWTGAEIKSCCRLAALLDLPLKQAAQNVVPVAVTASEAMDRLRTWASGRCLSASESGIYRQTNGSPKTRRRVNPEPSNN